MHRLRQDLRDSPSRFRSLPYRRDIDGLRCLAILPVVLYHAGVPFFASGFIGVDIFLVISGFLIGGIIDRQIRIGIFDLRTFWERRLRRLLPAVLVLIVVIQILSLFIISGRELRLSSVAAGSAILGISNIYFWWSTNYFAPALSYSPFLMTWSLGLEAQFYLIFPFVMMVASRRTPAQSIMILAGMTAISLLICLFLGRYADAFAFYMLPARFWELAIGATLALVHRHYRQPEKSAAIDILAVAGLALLLIASTALDQAYYPGPATLLPVIGTLALLHSQQSWINQRLFQWRPIVALGLISYSWYLWHMPLLELTELVTLGHPKPLAQAFVVLASLVLAYISWRFVEVRFRRPAPGRAEAGIMRHGAAAAIVGSMLVITILAHGFPQRLPTAARTAEMEIAEGRNNGCLAAYGATDAVQDSRCLDPAPRAASGVALLGDSHAAALGSTIAQKLRSSGRYLVQIEKAACQPVFNVDQPRPNRPSHAGECHAFNNAAFQRIARDTRIKTVILSGFWSAASASPTRTNTPAREAWNKPSTGSRDLQRALTQTIGRWRAAGKRVIVVGDVPLFRFNPAHAAMGDVIPARRVLREILGMPMNIAGGYGPSQWLRSSVMADAALAHSVMAIPNTAYISLQSALCDHRGCRYAGRDGVPYFTDYHHMSHAGADAGLAGSKF